MSTYVIGDIQGCYEEFSRLLDLINLDPGSDELWLVGDLINRGPNNAGVLDLLLQLPNVQAVFGNHDLHFLAVEAGAHKLHRSDTLDDLLSSPSRADYVAYLRSLPLLHVGGPDNNIVMAHAGLPPQLTLTECLALANEVETCIRSDDAAEFFEAMYGNEPDCWDPGLTGMTRLRVITNYFTRIRYCDEAGRMELTHKADITPAGFQPWFTFDRPDDVVILFGHWAALKGVTNVDFAVPLDTGCVWGGHLTALRLEDRETFIVEAAR